MTVMRTATLSPCHELTQILVDTRNFTLFSAIPLSAAVIGYYDD